MEKKKILWMSNVRFTDSSIKATGTWLQPLAEAVVATGMFEVFHISMGAVVTVTQEEVGGIHQYVLPYRKNKGGTQIPNDSTCHEVHEIIESVDPDLVHVWGTESIWAYMKTLGVFGNRKALLDMQGLMQSCYEAYYGGLSFTERLRCYGIKEIIRSASAICSQKKRFKRWAKVEEEILRSYDYISYQSNWIRNRLLGYKLNAKLFPTKIILRNEFYHAVWKPTNNESPVLFTISSGSDPYKGLSVLIKACHVIKQFYPNFVLNVVGNIMSSRYGIMSGYDSYIKKLISKYNLTDNIKFLGSLSSKEIIAIQLKSDVSVVPSFVESYCLGLAEAMAVGLPTVTSFAAAMPTIAEDKTETLFYNSLDYVDCAVKIMQIFEDKELAVSLSENGRKRRVKDNNFELVVTTQLDIYEQVFYDKSKSLCI